MDTRTNWLLIWLLLLAGLFAAAQFGKLTLALGPLIEVYGSAAAWLISIVGVVGILFGAVAGALVTRIGLARALLGALMLGGAVSVVQASLPDTNVLALLRVVEGFSHLAIVVACPTLMSAHSSDRDRPVVMGIWAAFFGISLALTALIMPSLLSLGGLSVVFIAHGAGLFICAGLLLPVLPKKRIAEAPRKIAYLSEHKEIYGSARRLLPGGGFVFYTILYIALIAVLPGLLNLPVWAISAIPLLSLTGTFAAGFLARSIEPVWISAAGFLASATLMITVAIMPNGAAQIAVLLTLFALMGLIPGACFASIPHYNRDLTDRARATGGIAQLGNVGTTTGTPIFVAAAQGGIWGVTGALVVFCSLGIAVLCALWLRVK